MKRWSKESLQPLYDRWIGGERLRDIGRQVGSNDGRLRQSFVRYGFNMVRANHNGNIGRPKLSPSHNNIVEPYEDRPKPRFDPEAHYASRHYKGSFG